MAEQKLRYVIEIAGDSASGGLAAISKAFNQAGIEADIAFKKTRQGAASAENSLKRLKTELSSSDRTVNFFTRSLAELGKGGEFARIGIGAFADMLMGGGVFGVGLAAAQAGMMLLGEHLNAEGKIAEETKKKNDEVFKKLIADAAAAGDAVADFNARTHGADPKIATLRKGAADLQPAIDAARMEMAARQGVVEQFENQESAGRIYAGLYVAKVTAEGELKTAEDKFNDLMQAQKNFTDEIAQINASASISEANRDRAARDAIDAANTERDKARTEKIQAELKTRTDYAIDEEKRLYDENAAWDAKDLARRQAHDLAIATMGQRMHDVAWGLEEARAAKEVATIESIAKSWADMGESIATTVGLTFAEVVKGSKSAGQAVVALGKTILINVIEMVKKIVLADAVSAAAGAASSQAAIPVVGPIFAATAMVAMLSMVQGLLGNMPSAAGGFDVGNINPITQLHAREMVLPAPLADRVRSMTDGGGTTVNVQIVTPDAKSVRRLLLDNTDALAEAIGEAQRKGRLG